MPRIATSALKPGMVLATEVLSRDGRVLFTAGAALEPWHVQVLRTLGVDAVEVTEPTARITLDHAAEYARSFFLYVNPDHPAMQALFEIAAERVLKRAEQGWVLPDLDTRQARSVEHLSDVFGPDQASAKEIVRHETELASFPDLYFRLKEMLDSPTSSARRIADLISGDVGLSAKLLRLVNSPIYAPVTPVDSVARAVTLVGTDELATLALGITAINYFKDIPAELIDMETFWRHSITCAVLAMLLAKRQGLPPERCFTAGLLHDVGRLLLFKKLPYASTEVMIHARENFLPLYEAERILLEFDHTDVSRALLAEWRFPEAMAGAISGHHDPMAAPDPRTASIQHLADIMANAVGIADGGMYAVPDLNPAAWDELVMQPTELHALMVSFDGQFERTLAAFL
jgi:HD-like signal output (HDOD) protein